MQRISLAWFSQMGAALHPLSHLGETSTPIFTIFDLYRARDYLATLSDERAYPLDLKASRPVIRDVLKHIDYVLAEMDTQEQQTKLDASRFDIWNGCNKLDTLLNGELAVQPSYHVWPKRAYNVEILIATGESVFSQEARQQFTEQEKYDAQQAGKCLAFEVSTAAAFHVFRCAESMLRRYYEIVVGKLPSAKMRNWGAYIKNLRRCGADERVLTILEQIKDLHRNPVIHPETQMQNEEALSLIGIIESAIHAMVMDMKKRKESAATPSLGLPEPEQPSAEKAAAAGLSA